MLKIRKEKLSRKPNNYFNKHFLESVNLNVVFKCRPETSDTIRRKQSIVGNIVCDLKLQSLIFN